MATQHAKAASLLTYGAEQEMDKMRKAQQRSRRKFDSSDDDEPMPAPKKQNYRQDLAAFEEEKEERAKPKDRIFNQSKGDPVSKEAILSDDSIERLRDLKKPQQRPLHPVSSFGTSK